MKLFLYLLFTICISTSFAQNKNQFYALDSQMNQTVLDSSRYILWIHLKEDSNWQWDYYRTWGPLIKSVSYADHDGTILNGRSFFYTSIGNLDSTGNFDHGKKNDGFTKFRSSSADSIIVIRHYEYLHDSLEKFTDLSADSFKKKEVDTAKKTFAEYPGGVSNWYEYLKRHLQYPERAMKKNIQGTVRISFTIGADGDVTDIFLQKSIEYSIDQEAIKVIRDSGKWTPGTRDGVNVKTYELEPLRFGLSPY